MAPARAQVPDTVTVITQGAPAGQGEREVPDFSPATSPGGAFLRAMLLPGWGHAALGAYTRAGFYFAAESASGWMVVRNLRRLGAARDLEALHESAVRDDLAARGVTDPDSVFTAVEEDPAVAGARRLVEAREQQVQDWFALGLFLMFLSGVDAFVSAHLADFPEPVEVQITPTPRGGAQVGVSVGLGGPPR